jgi:hypothetical protein
MMGKALWAYQEVLKENRVENNFDHFLHFLLGRLKRKYAKSIGHSISQQIKLEAYSDCALVYNPQGSAKQEKLILHIPSLYESGCDLSPHFVMMAVIANMILDKDPDFEALVANKVSQYLTAFEKEDVS